MKKKINFCINYKGFKSTADGSIEQGFSVEQLHFHCAAVHRNLLFSLSSSQLRTALDKIEEMEMTNNHLVKRLEKMKANRNALLSQQ